MHPSPGRPETDCRPRHQQRSRKKDPGSEGPVEPAAEKQTEQCRDNNRPAENADLAEPRAERGFGIGTTLGLALGGRLRRACQAIEVRTPHDAASRSMGAAGAGLGRRYRTSCRTARACKRTCSTRALRSASSSCARTACTFASSSSSESPTTPSRQAIATSRPDATVKTPPLTAQKRAVPSVVRQRRTEETSTVNKSAWPGNIPKLPL